MKAPRHIERDGYHVLDWRNDPGLSVVDLWRLWPELVLERYLVNTCFDSGFLTLSELEKQDGWRMVGRLAHSPRIHRTEQIPHDQYDEWLIFDQPTVVEEFETMVNYGSFTPVDFDWEEKLERFWAQVLRLRPLHVIAENDGVYLLSRDEGVVHRVLNSEPHAAPNGGPTTRIDSTGASEGPPSVS
jgi:hypothetical protein